MDSRRGPNGLPEGANLGPKKGQILKKIRANFGKSCATFFPKVKRGLSDFGLQLGL